MAVSIRDSYEADTGSIDGAPVIKGIEIRPDRPTSEICRLVIGRADLYVKCLIEEKRLLRAHEKSVNTNISCFSLYDPLIGYHHKGPPDLYSMLLAPFYCSSQCSSPLVSCDEKKKFLTTCRGRTCSLLIAI